MNHDPRTATPTKTVTYAVTLKGNQQLRGKDLNLRPLGYEDNLMMAGPFVS
jgi:hypothetical protein